MRPGGGRFFRATLRPLFVGPRDSLIRFVERRNGIRTHGSIGLGALGIDAPDRIHYKPAPWSALRRALPRRSVTAADVFVDFGSGMGRVVFQAALRYPFKRVIGVELSPRLHAIAAGNLDRNRPRLRSGHVQLIRCDALEYDVPDDVTVVCFANPFTGEIFSTVVDHILASVDRRPRPVRLIYFNPVEHDRLMATGRVRVTRRVRGLRPGAEWARSNSTLVYAVGPRAPG